MTCDIHRKSCQRVRKDPEARAPAVLRQNMSRGGVEREGDTESEAVSRFQAVSTEPVAGLEPTNREIMT